MTEPTTPEPDSSYKELPPYSDAEMNDIMQQLTQAFANVLPIQPTMSHRWHGKGLLKTATPVLGMILPEYTYEHIPHVFIGTANLCWDIANVLTQKGVATPPGAIQRELKPGAQESWNTNKVMPVELITKDRELLAAAFDQAAQKVKVKLTEVKAARKLFANETDMKVQLFKDDQKETVPYLLQVRLDSKRTGEDKTELTEKGKNQRELLSSLERKGATISDQCGKNYSFVIALRNLELLKEGLDEAKRARAAEGQDR